MIGVAALGVDVVEQPPAAVKQRAKLSGDCLLAFRAAAPSLDVSRRRAEQHHRGRSSGAEPDTDQQPLWGAWVKSAIGISTAIGT
jgi:hypothetical protein